MICGMYARMYARACCACNRTVRTGQHDSEGSSPTIYSSLITFIETVKHIIVIVFFKLNLVISFQHPGDQPARLAGHDHMITVAPRLLGQSSSTPVAPRRPTGTKQADGSHAGCVAGTGKARMF